MSSGNLPKLKARTLHCNQNKCKCVIHCEKCIDDIDSILKGIRITNTPTREYCTTCAPANFDLEMVFQQS